MNSSLENPKSSKKNKASFLENITDFLLAPFILLITRYANHHGYFAKSRMRVLILGNVFYLIVLLIFLALTELA